MRNDRNLRERVVKILRVILVLALFGSFSYPVEAGWFSKAKSFVKKTVKKVGKSADQLRREAEARAREVKRKAEEVLRKARALAERLVAEARRAAEKMAALAKKATEAATSEVNKIKREAAEAEKKRKIEAQQRAKLSVEIAAKAKQEQELMIKELKLDEQRKQDMEDREKRRAAEALERKAYEEVLLVAKNAQRAKDDAESQVKNAKEYAQDISMEVQLAIGQAKEDAKIRAQEAAAMLEKAEGKSDEMSLKVEDAIKNVRAATVKLAEGMIKRIEEAFQKVKKRLGGIKDVSVEKAEEALNKVKEVVENIKNADIDAAENVLGIAEGALKSAQLNLPKANQEISGNVIKTVDFVEDIVLKTRIIIEQTRNDIFDKAQKEMIELKNEAEEDETERGYMAEEMESIYAQARQEIEATIDEKIKKEKRFQANIAVRETIRELRKTLQAMVKFKELAVKIKGASLVDAEKFVSRAQTIIQDMQEVVGGPKKESIIDTSLEAIGRATEIIVSIKAGAIQKAVDDFISVKGSLGGVMGVTAGSSQVLEVVRLIKIVVGKLGNGAVHAKDVVRIEKEEAALKAKEEKLTAEEKEMLAKATEEEKEKLAKIEAEKALEDAKKEAERAEKKKKKKEEKVQRKEERKKKRSKAKKKKKKKDKAKKKKDKKKRAKKKKKKKNKAKKKKDKKKRAKKKKEKTKKRAARKSKKKERKMEVD